jgi:nicotinate-nucleotide adenylyltransferase
MVVKRLGVFGGTFDPIHHGHLFIAQEAADRLDIDRVLFVPTGPAHHLRRVAPGASPHDRAAMVQLAIEDNPTFALSTVEVDRSDPSFTVDTLRTISARWPEHQLYFICGMDSLDELPGWHDPTGILQLAELVAVERGGRSDVDLRAIEAAVPAARGRVSTLASPGLEISASDVRERLATGRSVRYLVPDPVIGYIASHGLYTRASGEI